MPQKVDPKRRFSRGFRQTGSLVKPQIRSASETRGFSQTRLLTHWQESVGAEIAKICEPVKLSYAQKGIGATLTVLVKAAVAPQVQMQVPVIIDRVNAVFGYRAVTRVRITQTAPLGFAEERKEFARSKAAKPPTPQDQQAAQGLTEEVSDEGLRAALAALGGNVIASRKSAS